MKMYWAGITRPYRPSTSGRTVPAPYPSTVPSCLVVQHVAPEGPYAVGDALAAAGVDVTVCRVFAGDPVPEEVDGLDGVVVMGGPMSAATDDGFPTRKAEIGLLADALRRELPTLGVCLGAQLLAAAAGGRVTEGTAGSEIGWAPVDLTAAATGDPLLDGLPDRLEVLHWHGDTFSLPPGAVHLATSPRYASQAFRAGRRAWGLQFHVEVTRPAVDAFVAAFGDEGGVIDGADAALAALAPVRDRIVTRFAGLVSGVLTVDN